MATRKIKSLSSGYVQKIPDVMRYIPRLSCSADLDEHLDEFTKKEALALYQTLNEIEIWDCATWEERSILAPIVGVSYNHNNVPVVTFPRFTPLCSEEDAMFLEEDEAIVMLQEKLNMFGYNDEQIGFFIEQITNFCIDYNVSEEDILRNLNNVGYHPVFGVRIIDYGLSGKEVEWYNT